MTPQRSPDPSGSEEPGAAPGDPGSQDPWAAFGYFVAGVGLYGFVGWVLGQWLDAEWLLPVGILFGVLAAMYMVFKRYAYRGDDKAGSKSGSTAANRSARRGGQQADDDDGETST